MRNKYFLFGLCGRGLGCYHLRVTLPSHPLTSSTAFSPTHCSLTDSSIVETGGMAGEGIILALLNAIFSFHVLVVLLTVAEWMQAGEENMWVMEGLVFQNSTLPSATE